MTEDEAKAWVAGTFGDDACRRVATFVEAVIAESGRQNMVARSTLDTVWQRHVVDSAQLISLADRPESLWVDIGTGAGFPGMVVALIRQAPTVLVEPRRKRAEFLRDHVQRAEAGNYISVEATTAEKVISIPAPVASISARAVASLANIFAMSRHFAGDATQYLLHRGQSIADDLENAAREWHGMFHVEPSMTHPDSGILIATTVRPR